MIKKILATTAALVIGASPLAMAQGTSTPSAMPSAQSGSSAVNGQERGAGPNAQSYGTKKKMGREQPEEKTDMGSGSGK